MGQGLSRGKPLLIQGKVRPAVGPDIPGHAAGHLVGVQSPLPPDNGQRLRRPPPVVGQKGLNPGGQIRRVPVAGEGQPGRIGPNAG